MPGLLGHAPGQQARHALGAPEMAGQFVVPRLGQGGEQFPGGDGLAHVVVHAGGQASPLAARRS